MEHFENNFNSVTAQEDRLTGGYLFTYRVGPKKFAMRMSLHGWMLMLRALVIAKAIDPREFHTVDPINQFCGILRLYHEFHKAEAGANGLVGKERVVSLIEMILTDFKVPAHVIDKITKAAVDYTDNNY